MDGTILQVSTADYFIHVRIITGMIISLSMSRVLLALVHYVQFPQKYKLSGFHICWLIIYSLYIVDWWWDVLDTRDTVVFSYGNYFVAIMYSFSFYFGAALITPAELPMNMNFNRYFMSIKRWFYSIFFINLSIGQLEAYLSDMPDAFTVIDGYFLVISAVTMVIAIFSKSFSTQKFIAAITLVLQLLIVFIQIYYD